MPTPVPGQRTAQPPLTAGKQANAALGRMAAPAGSMARFSLFEINGVWWRSWYPAGSTVQYYQNTETGQVLDTPPDFTTQEGS